MTKNVSAVVRTHNPHAIMRRENVSVMLGWHSPNISSHRSVPRGNALVPVTRRPKNVHALVMEIVTMTLECVNVK